MLPPVVAGNLEASRGTEMEGHMWGRFAEVAEALTGKQFADPSSAVAAGLEWLRALAEHLAIPGLRTFGVVEAEIPYIVAGSRGSSMRYNPIELNDEQLTAMLEAAL